MVKMFLNGGGMSDGPLHGHLHGAPLLRPMKTAAKYRFFSVRDQYPALQFVGDGGFSIEGELYELSEELLRDDLLPAEPPELELGIIELDDGSSSFSMLLRKEAVGTPGLTDISELGGWRAYRSQSGSARQQ